MRIIAGTHKGQPIASPPSRETRPTGDRVREALMSSVMSQLGGFAGASVLDGFAGSGALGLESLSRGAAHATFFETLHKTRTALTQNIQTLDYAEQTKVYSTDIFSTVARLAPSGTGSTNPVPDSTAAGSTQVASFLAGAPFDLVFLDPPYKTPPAKIAKLLAVMDEKMLLKQNAIVAYEFGYGESREVEQELSTSPFELSAQKRYGSTAVLLMRYTREW